MTKKMGHIVSTATIQTVS